MSCGTVIADATHSVLTVGSLFSVGEIRGLGSLEIYANGITTGAVSDLKSFTANANTANAVVIQSLTNMGSVQLFSAAGVTTSAISLVTNVTITCGATSIVSSMVSVPGSVTVTGGVLISTGGVTIAGSLTLAAGGISLLSAGSIVVNGGCYGKNTGLNVIVVSRYCTVSSTPHSGVVTFSFVLFVACDACCMCSATFGVTCSSMTTSGSHTQISVLDGPVSLGAVTGTGTFTINTAGGSVITATTLMSSQSLVLSATTGFSAFSTTTPGVVTLGGLALKGVRISPYISTDLVVSGACTSDTNNGNIITVTGSVPVPPSPHHRPFLFHTVLVLTGTGDVSYVALTDRPRSHAAVCL